MSDRVINFADMVLKLRHPRFLRQKGDCAHIRVTLDPDGEIVTCDDCGRQVSAFWALKQMAEKWHEHARKVSAMAEQAAADAKTVIHLKAARVIERLWRGKKYAPICPHCRCAILPEDRFGESTASVEFERARRARKSQGAPQ